MLVLSRDVGERIIAGDVVITLVAVRSSTRARIGIEAPPEVPVHRQEIFNTIVRKHGPYPETRRVPVELLRRISARLVDGGYGAADDVTELKRILEGRA